MAPPAKFTDEQLKQYLDMGFSQAEIARLFHVTEGAIAHRVAKLQKPAAVREPQVVKAAQQSVFDTRSALEENYRGCLALLQDPDVDAVQVRRLVLDHIREGLRVLEKAYALSEQQAFMDEVLNTLEECDPGSRIRILERIQNRHALRAAFTESCRALPPGG